MLRASCLVLAVLTCSPVDAGIFSRWFRPQASSCPGGVCQPQAKAKSAEVLPLKSYRSVIPAPKK